MAGGENCAPVPTGKVRTDSGKSHRPEKAGKDELERPTPSFGSREEAEVA